jgi:hypothetical protein
MNRRRLHAPVALSFAVAVTLGTTLATSLAATGTAQAFQSSHSCSSLSALSNGSVTGTHCLGGLQGIGPIFAPGSPTYLCNFYSFGPVSPTPYFSTITGSGCVEE